MKWHNHSNLTQTISLLSYMLIFKVKILLFLGFINNNFYIYAKFVMDLIENLLT